MSIISVKNLNITLGAHHILENITFEVAPGEIVAIVGPNGSGKTTLLKALLGFLPYEGEITLLGKTPAQLPQIASKIGYVPQRLDFDRTMPITVEELFAIHLLGRGGKQRISEALRVVGAERLLKSQLGVLSGGEFQRVLLALAIVNRPEILFLDEPAASIDIEGASEVYALVQRLQQERGMTVLLVSHDVDVVFRHATSVLCVNHKLLCKGTPHEALTSETMHALYGGQHEPYRHKEKRHEDH